MFLKDRGRVDLLCRLDAYFIDLWHAFSSPVSCSHVQLCLISCLFV